MCLAYLRAYKMNEEFKKWAFKEGDSDAACMSPRLYDCTICILNDPIKKISHKPSGLVRWQGEIAET